MLKVQHSIADSGSLLKTIQRNYPRIGARDCGLLAMGCGDNYLINASRKNYVFRLYRKDWWPEAEIDAELRLLEVLRRHKINVCNPVRSRDGERYITTKTAEGTRYGALFGFIPGRPLGRNFGKRNANMRRLGEMTAKFHATADAIDPPIQRWTMDFDAIVSPLFKAATSVLGHREKDLVYLRKLAAKLETVLYSHSNSELDFGLCHGDLHAHNVMLQPDGELTIFDFDWCGYSWRAYDLATVWWSLPRDGKSNSPWRAFFNGYIKQRKLSRQEKELMPWFVILREFELLNFHLSVRKHFGSAWQDDNYYDHHIGFFRKWSKQHLNP
jgi:Ser/Thr protein kinase RdoA (MazF antagonist)